jgi:hypothetical protein
VALGAPSYKYDELRVKRETQHAVISEKQARQWR